MSEPRVDFPLWVWLVSLTVSGFVLGMEVGREMAIGHCPKVVITYLHKETL